MSLRTLGLAAKVFAAAGSEPVAVVECNPVSAGHVPTLLEIATERAGVSTIAVGQPALTLSVQLLTAV